MNSKRIANALERIANLMERAEQRDLELIAKEKQFAEKLFVQVEPEEKGYKSPFIPIGKGAL